MDDVSDEDAQSQLGRHRVEVVSVFDVDPQSVVRLRGFQDPRTRRVVLVVDFDGVVLHIFYALAEGQQLQCVQTD